MTHATRALQSHDLSGEGINYSRMSTGPEILDFKTLRGLLVYLHTGCTEIILEFVIKYWKNWMK